MGRVSLDKHFMHLNGCDITVKNGARKLLVIEDEEKVAQYLSKGLQEAGYQVDIALTGEDGLIHWLKNDIDLVILDLNLPGRDGLEVLKIIREKDVTLPVIILSARDTTEDKVLGLESGADDYLIKPFEFNELLARIRVRLRHEHANTLEYVISDLSVDVLSRKVKRNNTTINLTPREFEILELLLRNAYKPVSRQVLAKDVWRVERATPLDNVIDVHVMRLRKKIDGENEKRLIHTIRGLGFVISDREDDIP